MTQKKLFIKNKKIVVIGGGTGTSVVLSGLKEYPCKLTAIVSVTDSGGSSGRLRTEFGFLPVGDMRQCLAALADNKGNEFIRKLLLYRFSKGKGLEGHNLGNLLLIALTDITGLETKAVSILAHIFRLKGEILPITLKDIQLKAIYENKMIIFGENEIDEPKHKGGKKIVKLTTKPQAEIYFRAKKAILNADLIILGPGDLYTSILPNLIIKGTKEALSKSKAKIVYIVNLMTRYSQTHKMTALDHVKEIKKYMGFYPDYILINKSKIPKKILHLYLQEKGFPVKDDLKENREYKVIREDFLAPVIYFKPKGDSLQRSYLRHSPQKLAECLINLLS